MSNDKYFLEAQKIVAALAPSADVYNGNPATDIISLKNYERCTFLLFQKTAGTNTGKATVTLEECDDVSASNSTAIAGKYRKNESAGSSDTLGDLTAFTTAGFSTTANKTAVYAVEVDAVDLTDGYPFVRLQLTEATNDPVYGCVMAVLSGASVKGSSLVSALS